ncbi:MAG TPA: helix-turn-helix transcriptional regulator [Nitrospira sp.]|nr:helix-turn-helix transcriptional regulator [Nitrospira sp.]
MMKKTNFDLHLEQQLRDPNFAERFKRAGEAWDVALQIAALREKAGLSQKDLARKLKTSQQQISRIESPSYEGHSLSMLRRVAQKLHARVRVVLEPEEATDHVAETPARYRTARRIAPNRTTRSWLAKKLRS